MNLHRQQEIFKQLAKNTAALSITQVARIGLNTILALLVARQLGPEGLGKYAVFVAYLQVFQVLTVLGVPQLIIREMARKPNERRYWFQRAVITQLLGAVVSTVILILVANILSYTSDMMQALKVVSLSLFPFAISSAVESAFQARGQMGFIALAQTGARGIQVAGSILAILIGHGIVTLAWMVFVGQCLTAIIEITIARGMNLWHDFRLNLGESRFLFRQSFDFFILSAFVITFSKLDILILSQLAGERMTGLYNAAYLVIQVVNFLSASYGNAAYPVLSHLSSQARTSFEILLRKSLLFGTTTTLLVAILLVTAAKPIIGLLYQDGEYTMSVRLLQLLGPFVIVFMWNSLLSKGLMVNNLQRRSVIVSGVKLGAGLLYYALLTAWLGIVGTAVATVLAGLTGTVLNYYFLTKEVCSLDLVTLVVKPLTIGAILLIILRIAWGLPWPVLIVSETLLYVLLLIIFRILSREDLRLCWQMIYRWSDSDES